MKENPRGIFGVPLNVSIKYANVAISLTNDNGESFIYGYVPIVVAKCGVFLKEKATDVEGIFRLSGSAKRIKDLQEIFDSPERYGKGLDWTGYTVHDAANVLRRYLNQLPEPIVPLEFYERFREPLRLYQNQIREGGEVTGPETFDHTKAVAAYQQLIRELPPLNRQLLLYILDLLAVFASKSDQNRMTSANLAAIFQPGLLSHPQHHMSPDEYRLSQDVLIFLIENQDHFLFGMNGTAADEQTVKEVEGGLAAPRRSSNFRRSVSSASNGTDSYRKLETLRRNVSVSSRNSRTSGNVPSPTTPSSLNGSGVHRSNTLPPKMSPVIGPARYGRRAEQINSHSPAATAPAPAPAADHHHRPSSQAPHHSHESANYLPPQKESTGMPKQPDVVYVHSSTHGPVPVDEASRLKTAQRPRLQGGLPPADPSPLAVVTPPKERKLSSLFSKSPSPSREPRDSSRQPNKLRKKRLSSGVSESAWSSSHSLAAVVADPPLYPPSSGPSDRKTEATGTVRPANTSEPSDQPHRDAKLEHPMPQDEHAQLHFKEGNLRPPASRTPSMNSRSSFTDQSDLEPPDNTTRTDRREHRREWRFSRSSKRGSEHTVAASMSPPRIGVNPAAALSTNSVNSWHRGARSPPPDLQRMAADGSSVHLSLDAEVANNVNRDPLLGQDSEKKSFFGRFKAKLAHALEGDTDSESERERTKSPVHSDAEGLRSNTSLPPNGKDSEDDFLPLTEQPPRDTKEEVSNPSTLPNPPFSARPSGMPPSIPEEPAILEPHDTAADTASVTKGQAEPADAGPPTETSLATGSNEANGEGPPRSNEPATDASPKQQEQ